MKKTICMVLAVIFVMTACSSPQVDVSAPATTPSPTAEPIPTATVELVPTHTPSLDAIPTGFNRPGFVAETEAYTFFTNLKHVFRMDNRTGETVKIFSSISSIYQIYEYAGDLYVDNYRMDYNGNNLLILPTSISIEFAADGYIYYSYFDEMRRKPFLHEQDEYNAFLSEDNTFNISIITSDESSIGYYAGKVYYQKNQKIYSMTIDGEETYCWDGEYVSLNKSKLIFYSKGVLYINDLETGNEKTMLTSQRPEYADYIGSYKDNEYYVVDGKIYFVSGNSSELAKKNQLPLGPVGTAVVADEWIYMDGEDIMKYNLETKMTIPIDSGLVSGTDLYISNNYIYYAGNDAIGITRVDLNTHLRKLIYYGTVYDNMPMDEMP